MKLEAYNCYKAARMINSRSDYFKVFSGPYFKSIEQQIFAMSTFIKHVPVPERYKKVLALKRGYKYYYSTDYTSFEAHFTETVMQAVECQLYRKCFKHDKNLKTLVGALTGENRCRTRTGLRCKVKARRMSGDMCTSLGNGFTNYMLLTYIMHRKGATENDFECLIEGDDCIVGSNVELTEQDYTDLGFTIKIDRVDDPCKASFCGLICAENGVNIRDPARHFEKFGWTHSCCLAGEKVMHSLLKAKAMSTLCECPDCPVIAQVAWESYKLCKEYDPRWEDDYYINYILRPMDRPEQFREPNPPIETRLLFEEMFGISIQQQLLLEDAARAHDLSKFPSVVTFHPDVLDYALKFVVSTL